MFKKIEINILRNENTSKFSFSIKMKKKKKKNIKRTQLKREREREKKDRCTYRVLSKIENKIKIHIPIDLLLKISKNTTEIWLTQSKI